MSIEHSEKLDQFFSALSELQGELENAKKNKTGYIKNHKYADLGQYIDVSKDLLAKHGFCIMQPPEGIEIVEVTNEIKFKEGDNIRCELHNVLVPKQKVTTIMGHKSGQFISSSMDILVDKTDSNSWGQSTGKAVTFSRRYSIAGDLNMTQEDNDNEYSQKDVDKTYSKPTYINKITKDQIVHLQALLSDDPPRLEGILKWANVKVIEDMAVESYAAAIKILIKEKDKHREKNSINKNDSKPVTPNQRLTLLSLVTTERLNKILKDYNLTELGELTLGEYNKIYNELRLETTTNIINNEVLNIKQVN